MIDILDENGKKTGELCGGNFVKKFTFEDINATSSKNDLSITYDRDEELRKNDAENTKD